VRDMSISPEEKRDEAQPSVVSDSPRYPYGLKIHFDEKSFKKLGLSEVPKVGDKYMILAYAEVCDMHQNKKEGDEMHLSMGMQLTEVEVKKKEKESKTTEQQLYGE